MSTRPGVASGHQSVHLRMCEPPPTLGHNKWQQQHFVSSPLSLFLTLCLPPCRLVVSQRQLQIQSSRRQRANDMQHHAARCWELVKQEGEEGGGRWSGRGVTAEGVTWPFGEISMLMRPLGTYQSDKPSKRRSSSCATSASKSI